MMMMMMMMMMLLIGLLGGSIQSGRSTAPVLESTKCRWDSVYYFYLPPLGVTETA